MVGLPTSSRRSSPRSSLRQDESRAEQQRGLSARERHKKYKDVPVITGFTLVETLAVTAPVTLRYTQRMCYLAAFMSGLGADPAPPQTSMDLAQALECLDSLSNDDVNAEVVE